MGLPMARRLLAAGYSVRGFDLSSEARAAITQAGGLACASAAAAAAGANDVITMLPSGATVRAALLGDNGALATLAQNSLVIDMSSSAPTDTVALHDELRGRGYRLVDAPVSGGVRRAIDGTLTIMAGGAAADVVNARPMLETMGTKIFSTGGPGSGHAMKALNNFVSAAGAVAAMEAVIVGCRFGLDAETMVDILNVSTGRNNTTETKMKQFVLSETWGSGFALALMAKDVGIAAGLSRALDLETPMLASAALLWSKAAQVLGSGADHTEIMRFLQSHTRTVDG
ncbi:MAG: NAD(P)-dependent oxidoreductase [Mesorhizobium sp.]|nr:NAD(P)-dependent oxidoreductase [Mesorhizobium sp.]